jgi:Cys-tRNA(Pro) deacylase
MERADIIMNGKSAFNEIVKILEQNNIKYKIHSHEDILNVYDAEKKLDYDCSKGFKTLAFVVGKKYVFVVLNGRAKLNYKKLADILDIKRNELQMADINELESKFGYTVGGISPIPVSDEISVIFDSQILDFAKVYCGMGESNKSLEIESQDLINVSKGKVFNIIDNK